MAVPKIRYYLKTRAQKEGRQIMLRVTKNQERASFYVGYVIPANQWDKKRLRINSRYTGSDKINVNLEKYELMLKDVVNRLEGAVKPNTNERVPYTLKDVRREFERVFRPGALNKSQQKNWAAYLERSEGRGPSPFETYLVSKGLSKGTIKSHKSRADMFGEYLNLPDTNFTSFTSELLADYVDYMFDVTGLEPGYIKNRLLTVRIFLRFLNSQGISIEEEVLNYRPTRKIKTIEKPAISIKPDEYDAIYTHVAQTEHLQKIKDLFILQYNSALRHSDSNIDIGDIQGGKIVKITDKTDTIVQAPITPHIQEVLTRYNNNPPYMSGQKFNEGLKELFKAAGINTLVKVVKNKGGIRTEEVVEKHTVASSKIGRKSFISQMKRARVADELIGKVTGHKRAIEARPYVDMHEEDIESAVMDVIGNRQR